MVLKVIKHVLGKSEHFIPFYAESFAEAQALVEAEKGEFFAAVVDLNLPDAPNGEVVDFALSQQLPTVVLTGSFSPERRSELLAKGVVDYVTKEGRYSYEYVLQLVHRLIKNENIPVLVVDDSTTGRKYISNLLKLHRYQVYEAKDGVDAIKVLLENDGIRLLITDYNMPRMDGCQLVQNIRGKYEKTDVVVIALSGEGEEALSARFIKAGANDFLRKPFNQEEFICRITHNVEMLEMIEQIQDSANRDYYTNAYNRYYFFERGEQMLAQAQEKNVPVAGVVIDLDGFKEINQQFGNEVGDLVMKEVAKIFMKAFERFLIARSDGQEFYGLMLGLDQNKALAFVEKVRQVMGTVYIAALDKEIPITFSAGVSNQIVNSVDHLIKAAHLCLDRAKEAGGDLVFGDE